MKRTWHLVLVTALALMTTACGINHDPLAGNPSGPKDGSSAAVIVGATDSTESQVLAELYAQAIRAKGVDAATRLNVGARDVYVKALQEGSISVVGDYTGHLLLFFDRAATATTAAELEQALPGAVTDLRVGTISAATNQDVYVVSKAYSRAHGVTSLADLEQVSTTAVLGGPATMRDRPDGPEGLATIYGATFKKFRPYGSLNAQVKDLNDDRIQVAAFSTTASAIVDHGYVTLDDPQSMVLPQNVVPLMTPAVADNPVAAGAIDAVQAALTTKGLAALDRQVDVKRVDPAQVAGQWLASQGLA